MNYKPYPKHKPSNIQWLGDIPSHWEVKKMRYILLDGSKGIRIGPFGSSLNAQFIKSSGYKVYGQENVIKENFSMGNRFIDDAKFKELKVNQIFPGDLIVTMMGTVGKAQIVPDNIQEGIMDSHLIRLRTKQKIVDSAFLEYLINKSYYIKVNIKTMSKGSIMEGLNSSIIKSLFIALPPLTEQHAIAAFLDRKTKEIDSFLETKKNLIAVLKEQKAAIINDAVTGKYNSALRLAQGDNKTKPSGIEWLGDIPSHWEVKKLKWVFRLSRGFDLSNEQFVEGKYPVQGSNGAIGFHNKFTTKGPGITVGRSGSVGEVNFITTDFWAHNTALYVINTKNNIKYIYYLLKILNLKELSSGSAVGTLNRNYVHILGIPLPPLPEQQAIVAHIEKEMERIDYIIQQTEKEMELMKEYKQALISEAVTGKIRVE